VAQQPLTAHDAPNVRAKDKRDATNAEPTTKATTGKEPNKYDRTLSSAGYATNHQDPTTLGKQTT
jgi:hypothetical protein